ncbi:3'-5' exoribonuclease [Mesorhizobium sp. M0145]|uniref:3'-5' exonuclease n=1 Tax=Mesorhizobium sp. M0145 TaxID=2956895 RepID=UPI0033373BA7
MKFTHLMIDLETMGTAANAPVVAIGAVYFDPDTGTLGETFDAAIDVEDAVRYGRVSGSTIKWWLGQGDAARQKIVRGRHPSQLVFEKFYEFCLKHGDGVKPWGNGASFDITILDYAFGRILDKPAPWKFWNVRDCRTIKELADGIVKFTGTLEGVAHTALDDAKHQAEWVSVYWQGLRKPSAAPAAVITASPSDDFDF